MDLKKLREMVRKHANTEKAKVLKRFFKTGPGEYAEGDIFLGIKVPVLRDLAKQYKDLKLTGTLTLLKSPIHEERLLALLILIHKYRAAEVSGKERIYKAYLRYRRFINNWDLVDVSAKHIVGDYLYNRNKKPLYRLARSRSLWERRIAIISTFNFIEKRQFDDTLKIAEMLLLDDHDLIHKAVGWMLREVGKRDRAAEERFLEENYTIMPRTMLRYAIEKFQTVKRRAYLNKGGEGCKGLSIR